MILWWIGNAVLLIVVLPLVVYLLHGVLTAASSIVPSVNEIGDVTAAASEDLDATALLLTTQDQVAQHDRGGRRVRRLARCDPRRRVIGGGPMSAAGIVMIVIVALIVAALVVYLVATILQLRAITTGLDRVIGNVGEILEKTGPVNEVVTSINQNLDAGVSALEGLLVKKAGIDDAVGLVDGLYPGAAAAGLRDFPESASIVPPRIGEVYTKGTLTLARLGREAPIAMANPAGPVLRNTEAGSLAARSLYPEVRQTRPETLPRSPVIGSGAPVQYEQRDDIGAPRKHMPSPAR